MRSPLQRLYLTKLVLLAVIFVALGVALLVLARQTELLATVKWLAGLPLAEVGSTLFGSGLIVVAFEFINRRDADELANERLRKILKEEAPAIRDAVIDGFAVAPDRLADVASPETLDRVIRNTLGIQLGDQDLADDLYADLRHQVMASTERRHDMRVSVNLAPWTKGSVVGEDSMFVATIRREYRVMSSEMTRRFACVSDPDEYRDLLLDPTSMVVHQFEPVAGIDATSSEAFELLQFTVDGRPRPIRRSKRSGGQSFTVTTGHPAGETTEVEIAYTYRVLVRQNSHLFYLAFGAPCKGVEIDFSYGDCGIGQIRVLDFIPSANPTRVSYSPKDVAPQAVSVRFDGWVFPKSGVAFAWVLEREMIGAK